MKEDSNKLRQDSRVNQSQVRIRENLSNTLTRKFVDVMKVKDMLLNTADHFPQAFVLR